MKIRIPRMLAMMAMPPAETIQRAARSAIRRRRGVWRLRFCRRSLASAEELAGLSVAMILRSLPARRQHI
jgi:hypothetical protein